MPDCVEYPKIIVFDHSFRPEPEDAKSLASILLDSVESGLGDVTEGPWSAEWAGCDCCVWISSPEHPNGGIGRAHSLADAQFMANSRTQVPALIALARQQDAKLMAIRKLVEASEEDRRVRQEGNPLAQFADAVIDTGEITDILNVPSES